MNLLLLSLVLAIDDRPKITLPFFQFVEDKSEIPVVIIFTSTGNRKEDDKILHYTLLKAKRTLFHYASIYAHDMVIIRVGLIDKNNVPIRRVNSVTANKQVKFTGYYQIEWFDKKGTPIFNIEQFAQEQLNKPRREVQPRERSRSE